MASLFGRSFCTFFVAIALVQLAGAAVIFKSGEKGHYVAPGEEEISGNAKELFEAGQAAEQKGNVHRAISCYRSLVRRHPKDALAPGAAYRSAELLEKVHNYLVAANAYRGVVERYPTSPRFNDAIEAQFRIGEVYLNGKKIKLLGISVASSLDHAVEIFAAIIRTAPYGKYTARAQFDIGRAREKEGAQPAAIQAYQAVVEKFPNSPVAPDAQYQIGYIYLTAAREGAKDIAAANNARTAFQDFLFRYPNSEKAAQARADMALLEHKETSSSLDIAKYYDKQKYYRAAVIYYNEVIRQQPGSAESEKARRRLDELKKKLGDKALMPAYALADAEKKKAQAKGAPAEAGQTQPNPQGAANNAAPLPPPADRDTSLPPPAPLMPDVPSSPPPAPFSGASDTSLDSGNSSSPSSSPTEPPASADVVDTGSSSSPSASPTESPASAEISASPVP
jgi:outer membrane protein assembly factor BamD